MTQNSTIGKNSSAGFHFAHAGVELDHHPFAFQRGLGPLAIERCAAGKDFIAHLHQPNADSTVDQVRQLAGQFHAGGSRANNDQPGLFIPLLLQVVEPLLEAAYIAEVTEAGAVFLDAWNAEIIGFRARRQHQL